MSHNLEKSSDRGVALSFQKISSIVKEISIIILAVASLVGGFEVVLLKLTDLQTAIALKPAVGDRAIGLFSVYVAISLAIESTIEIYLKAFRQDISEPVAEGDQVDVSADDNSKPKTDNKRIATIASLMVGIAISFAGVRFLEPFFDIGTLKGYQVQLFHALDILLTAGLLSGGSDGIHQVTSLYRKRVNEFKPDQ